MTGTSPTRPLEGIKVLEGAVWHASPGAGAILADLGAEVIRVESPGGDPQRSGLGSFVLKSYDVDVDGWNVIFDVSNRNKKSLRLDLRTEAGCEVVRRLTATTDVFVTNLQPLTKQKLGIDYESLAAVNPKLVHVNITEFGSRGERADHGAFYTLGSAGLECSRYQLVRMRQLDRVHHQIDLGAGDELGIAAERAGIPWNPAASSADACRVVYSAAISKSGNAFSAGMCACAHRYLAVFEECDDRDDSPLVPPPVDLLGETRCVRAEDDVVEFGERMPEWQKL